PRRTSTGPMKIARRKEKGERIEESGIGAATHELHFTSRALFPLTPALSLRERVNCRPRESAHEALEVSERYDSCSLSPRERGGVRGKRAWKSRTAPKLNSHIDKAPHSQSAFTMIEIAICLAVIGFALAAIVGVLPLGMNVQRENREETIINQDAS